jgi:hypothetical protein
VWKVKNLKVKYNFEGKGWVCCYEGTRNAVFIATNLNVRVLALNGSCNSKSSLGSVARSRASVSGSKRCFPMPTLSKLTLSYLESSLHANTLLEAALPEEPNTVILQAYIGSKPLFSWPVC